MRTWVTVLLIELCCAGSLQAQTTDCSVSGYLFNVDGSPARQAPTKAIAVVNSGPSFVLTPIALTTDVTGFTTFTAPRRSIIWIAATALGLAVAGDVAIVIPDADSATLDVLAQSARPPVSGFSLTSGHNPRLALWLPDVGINLNVGSMSLGSVKDSGTASSAADSSSGQMEKARPSSESVRSGLDTTSSVQQAFARAARAVAPLTINEDIVTSGLYRFQFPAPPNGAHGNAEWVSAQTIGDASAADFNLAIASSPNSGSARNNIVTSWGYNNNGDGIRVVPTEPSLNYRIETFYSPNAGAEYMESHLQYESTKGKLLRPFSFQIDRNTNVSSMQIQTDGLSYLGPDETQYVKFMPHGVYLMNRTALASYVNNSVFIQQLNAVGNRFVNLAYLDGADRIKLGDGGTDVVVSGGLYLGSSGGTRLTDSSGAGLGLATSGGGGAFLTGTEVAAPPAPPAANGWKLYANDDGTGKTQLCVLFSTGPPQCFAKQQ
jgi:hypothetical protein